MEDGTSWLNGQEGAFQLPRSGPLERKRIGRQIRRVRRSRSGARRRQSGAGQRGLGPGWSGAMRRVVITGVGVVAPNGVGKEAFWSACANGRSGVKPIRCFDASAHPVRVAGEVPDFDVAPYLPPSQRKSLK